jgi:hypothetical protein
MKAGAVAMQLLAERRNSHPQTEEEEMSMPDVAEEGAEVAAEYDFPPFDFGGAHYPEEEVAMRETKLGQIRSRR